MISKKQLAIALSKLSVFENPDPKKEQYPTDSEVAAEMLWQAFMIGDIQDKTIADLGAGTGILGIGCLLLGAKFVYFVDKDSEAIKVLKKNIEQLEYDLSDKYEIRNVDVEQFKEKVDTVVENPPFGVQKAHADKAFLETSFKISKVIYSLHKPESRNFIEKICKDHDCDVSNYCEYAFPIKGTMGHHTRKIHRINVGCWRITSS